MENLKIVKECKTSQRYFVFRCIFSWKWLQRNIKNHHVNRNQSNWSRSMIICIIRMYRSMELLKMYRTFLILSGYTRIVTASSRMSSFSESGNSSRRSFQGIVFKLPFFNNMSIVISWIFVTQRSFRDSMISPTLLRQFCGSVVVFTEISK